MINKHGIPNTINVINKSDGDDVELVIELSYDDKIRTIEFTSKHTEFMLHVKSGGIVLNCKPYKFESYYKMLKYYVESNFRPMINDKKMGTDVLNIVNACIDLI